jgi:hypothetical protein
MLEKIWENVGEGHGAADCAASESGRQRRMMIWAMVNFHGAAEFGDFGNFGLSRLRLQTPPP